MDDWLPSERSGRLPRGQSGRTGVMTDGAADGGASQTTAESLAARVRPRPQPRMPSRRLVRRDVMIRRVDPWTVLKISVVFYTCMLIITMLANAVVWAVVGQLGLIEQLTEIAGALNIALEIRTGNILRAVFLVGVLGVIFWSAVNVFFAFLYNLVADLIGGIRVDLAEDE